MSDNMAAPDSTGACCPSPLAVSEDLPPKSSEPSSTPQNQPHPNQVRTVMLTGVPIVSLVIDGKERLCLAQISNTLLKAFSYNEIHNRRVALGITCVQCTPVQLEILRRAGAMPISSRRCGMITKREAERLCRSFLADSSPPKLPDNFSFDVTHECAWGSRGNFLPSRYNSSRAKCIKCFYCNMFFSPNKFIFHSHRLSESKYVQPDAANFNSWRRHLKLTGSPPIDVRYAWEDVKAMFNGGSRKRITSSHRFSSSSSSSLHGSKRIRQMESANEHHHPEVSRSVDTQNPQPSSTSPYNVPTNFPCYPAGKVFANNPYAPRPTLPPLPSTFVDWRNAGGAKPPHFNPNPYNFLHWPRQPHQPPPPPMPPTNDMMSHSPLHEENQAHDYDDHRAYNDVDSNSESSRYDSEHETRRRSVSSCSEVDFRSSDNEESRGNNSSGGGGGGVVVNLRPRFDSPTFLPASAVAAAADKPMYCSAFRPVVQRSSVHSVESLIRPSSSTAILRDVKLSVDSNSKLSLSPSGCKENGSVHSESIDVELTDEATTPNPPSSPWINKQQTTTLTTASGKISEHEINQVKEDNEVVSLRRHPQPPPLPQPQQQQPPPTSSSSSSSSTTACAGPPSPSTSHTLMVVNREMDSTQLAIMTKDELEQLLMGEAAARKRAEKKCELIKESLEEQVKREVAYREDMAKQLEIVKETLCNELDQERKARFAILQKLKEAHDALHHFSCKVLIPRHCTDCTYKPMLPQ